MMHNSSPVRVRSLRVPTKGHKSNKQNSFWELGSETSLRTIRTTTKSSETPFVCYSVGAPTNGIWKGYVGCGAGARSSAGACGCPVPECPVPGAWRWVLGAGIWVLGVGAELGNARICNENSHSATTHNEMKTLLTEFVFSFFIRHVINKMQLHGFTS